MEEFGASYNVVYRSNGKVKDAKNASSLFRWYIPYQLYLSPDEIFEIKMPGSDKIYKLQVISRTLYSADIYHNLLGLLPNESFKGKSFFIQTGDRFGITGYSQIQLIMDRFECIFNNANEPDWDAFEKVQERCCDIFNYFLDRYAAVTRHRQPSKISIFDINAFDVIYFNKDSLKPLFEIYFTTIHGATLTDKFTSPPKGVNDRLKELLLNNEPNSDFLGVNAVRSVFSGDYLDGIVLGVTQLESFIYRLFKLKFTEQNIDKTEDKLKALGLSNLLEMLKLLLDQEQHSKLVQACDFSKIRSAITIRNNYIHKGETGGIKTFGAAEAIVNEINNFCVELANISGLDHMMNNAKLGWNK